MRRFFIALLFLVMFAPEARERPRRFVSLSPSITEIFFAIGAGELLAGVVAPADHPPEASAIEIVAGYDRLDHERIYALGTTDCMTVSGMFGGEALGRLRDLKIRVTEYRMESLADLYSSIGDIGNETGKRKEALALVERMQGEMVEASRACGGKREKAVFVVGADPLVVAGKGTFLNDVMDLSGLANAFGDKSPSYFTASPEMLIEAAPSALLLTKGEISPEARQDLLGRLKPFIPGIRIIEVEADLIVRPSPRVPRGIAEICRQRAAGGKK